MTSATGKRRFQTFQDGFTLIEILVVISIIALLSSLTLGGVQIVQRNARIGAAKMEVMGLTLALDNYVQDEAEYPARAGGVAAEENELPALYGALFGERKPAGPGGRSAPYTRAERSNVVTYDEDRGEYRPATREEVRDRHVEKYLLDPFRNPYIYRVNKGRPPRPSSQILDGADIYSLGPNEADDTLACTPKSDDIGNW